MAATPILPIQFLRECFSYDPETGAFEWKRRPLHHFQTLDHAVSWNTQNAGSPAFATCDAGGYCRAEVRKDGRRYRLTAGRVAFALVNGWYPPMIDHRDTDKANNRIDNLRAADVLTNRWNRPKPNRGKNPLVGAYQTGRKWAARAGADGKKILLGTFDTPEEAHAAYCAFQAPRHGEFFNARHV